MPKWVKIVFAAAGGLVLAAALGFTLWGITPQPPMPQAEAALVSDGRLTVQNGKWIVFEPVGSQPHTGLIFYPGGHVDYRAYAPAARAIAQEGCLVVIPRMPLSLAVLDAGAAAEVMDAFPSVKNWVVGGHSLGGAMAANFASKNPQMVKGLVLWAAYPAGSDDLSASGLRVVSISGSRDGLATPAKLEASRTLLPADTTWVIIEGGNHAQFGWYGEQAGDQPAAISRQQQQDQAVAATLALIQEFE